MSYQKHCPGCFADKAAEAVCPACGYDESTPRSPLFLPHGLVLANQYRVGKVLGRPGGFGITYLCWDVHLQQRMAVKEYLPRELATRAPDGVTMVVHGDTERAAVRAGREQFLGEARIVARLNHPNVVRVRSFFNANDTAYLVMDYYEGRSLGDHLTQVERVMSPEAAIRLLLPVLDGLAYVHGNDVVHRDIKPHNIYLTAAGVPILLDFGAARQATNEQVSSLSVVVTEGYAPLEQYQRRTPQGPWTDIYGVAATLYRMLVGEAPPIAIDRIGDDPLAGNGWVGIPEGLHPILEHALAVRPEDRHDSAEALSRDLRHWLEGNPELARRVPATAAAPYASADPEAPTVTRVPAPPSARVSSSFRRRASDREPVAPRRRAEDLAPPVSGVRSAPLPTPTPTPDPVLPAPPPTNTPIMTWRVRILILVGVTLIGFAAGFAFSL